MSDQLAATLRSIPLIIVTASVFGVVFWRSRRQMSRTTKMLWVALLTCIVVAPLICIWFIYPAEHLQKLGRFGSCSGTKSK